MRTGRVTVGADNAPEPDLTPPDARFTLWIYMAVVQQGRFRA